MKSKKKEKAMTAMVNKIMKRGTMIRTRMASKKRMRIEIRGG